MYLTFRKYSVDYDLQNHKFSVFYSGKGAFVKAAQIKEVVLKDGRTIDMSAFGIPTTKIERAVDCDILKITYPGRGCPDLEIEFLLNAKEACVRFGSGDEQINVAGLTHWGDHSQQETMAVNLKGAGRALRSAYGPAASIRDNALFDRDTDSAVTFETGGAFRLRYDWAADAYGFSFATKKWAGGNVLKLHVENDVYARKFDVDYRKVNTHNTFPTPPVGWMTWYAVQFGASEKAVLENTKWLADNLKKYGANAVWVDWEWYHPDYTGFAPKDIDMYHPNKRAYPNGLGYVADKIKEAGFTPALWIGATVDPNANEMVQKYPDMVLTHTVMWCGQYIMDPTHPDFLEKALPKLLDQVKKWGFEAVKWDFLPDTTNFCDSCRDDRFDISKSSRESMKGAFNKARATLGEDFYMLYCAGRTERDMDLACGVFDAARIGRDIFKWDSFIAECIDKTMHYYPLHNVVCNNDPDNVIIRERFNTRDQAITRAAFVSLTGMPFTMGDNLPELPEERVEILRRSIPSVPAHPMDIASGKSDGKTVILNLAVEKPFMSYNVADVINLDTRKSVVHVDLSRDLGLEDGEYYVYDYWNMNFIGRVEGGFAVELGPCASGIYSVHKVQDIPQVISTSRHISQGAMDIVSMRFDPECYTIFGESNVVGGEDYEVVACAREGLRMFYESDDMSTYMVKNIGGNAWRCVFKPEKDGLYKWSIRFHPRHGSGIRMVF